MNKIYKTMLNASTGECVATSELAKGQGKSATVSKTNATHLRGGERGIRYKKTLLSTVIGVTLFSAFGNHAVALPLVYDGTGQAGTALIKQASDTTVFGVEGLPAWLSINPTDEGVVYLDDAGKPVLTGAELKVDYTSGTTPKFVIGGYARGAWDPLVENNSVNVNQGNVEGDVFGGLSHVTYIEPDFIYPSTETPYGYNYFLGNEKLNASDNGVIIADGASVNGNIYGGAAVTWLQQGNKTKIEDHIREKAHTVGSVHVTTDINVIDITLTANDNAVMVGNGSQVSGAIYGGTARLNQQTGEANAGRAYSINDDWNGLLVKYYTNSQTDVNDTDLVLSTSSNAVTVGDRSQVSSSIYGGAAQLNMQAGDATSRNLVLSDDVVVFGPSDSTAQALIDNSRLDASRNTVTLGYHNDVSGAVRGGYAQLIAQAGQAKSGDTFVNPSKKLTQMNADATADARISDAMLTADSNTVVMGDEGYVSGAIYGGDVELTAQAGKAEGGYFEITAGNFGSRGSASVMVESSPLTASKNVVTVGENSEVSGAIYGGKVQLNAKAGEAKGGRPDAEYNPEPPNFYSPDLIEVDIFADADASVTIKDTNITASNNTVTVGKGSQVGGSVYGGYAGLTAAAGKAMAGLRNGASAISSAAVNASNSQVLANDNTVTFDGILLTGNIVGGHTVFDITQGTVMGDNPLNDNSVDLTGSKAQATGNTVTIGDDAQFNASTSSLYGGSIQYNAVGNFKPESYDTFTGNTLNWSAKAPATFTRVGNFEHMNFTLNPVYANTDVALISATDIVLGTDGSNISDSSDKKSQISVVGIHSGNILQAGDEFILMNATNPLSGSGAVDTTAPNVAQQGISLLYDVDVNIKSNQVTATIQSCQMSSGEECPTNGGNNGGNNGPRVNPSLKSLLEGNLAAALLVTRGADVIADEVLGAINEQNHKNGLVPFVLISGDHTRYNTGSHIKSNDTILTGGLSYQQEKLTLGVFAESGWGSYDTYNNFRHAANVKGEGNARYYGVGVLGHYAFDNGFYTDGALRTGKAHNNFSSDLNNIASGESAHYTLNNHYVSAHLAVGYLLPLDDKNDLDLSAKYLYSTLSGKQAIVAGDPIRFDRINSNRVRLNASVNHQSNENVTLTAGLGYEHEFDGKAKATTYRVYNIDAPSVEGGTGIMSFGAHIQPTENKNLTLDFDGKGYVGKREGIGGTLRVNYAF